MKIIDRYILRQYFVPLSYLVAAFSLMYIILDLFERFPDFVEAKVGLWEAAVYYGYFLFAVNGFVPFLVMVMPFALLLSALYTLTLFARHNELTAMCASGVSLRRLMLPLMGVGLCVALVSAVAQETLGPAATRWIDDFHRRRIHRHESTVDLVSDFLYQTGVTHRQWIIKKFNQRQPNRLVGVHVIQERDDGSLAKELYAAKAEWLDGHWWFYELQQREYDQAGEPVGGLSKPSERPVEIQEYAETPAEFQNEATQESDYLSSWDMYQYLRQHPNLSGLGRAKRTVDLHARLAMPWTCLVMILLSLPATAGGVRRSALRSVGFGLAFLFGFYFLLYMGILLGKWGLIWPWLAGWFPNTIFLALGATLTARLE
jgi:lipopolysaccharide export system permease protein